MNSCWLLKPPLCLCFKALCESAGHGSAEDMAGVKKPNSVLLSLAIVLPSQGLLRKTLLRKNANGWADGVYFVGIAFPDHYSVKKVTIEKY